MKNIFTQEEGWLELNELNNKLRQAIIEHATQNLKLEVEEVFNFRDNNLDSYPTVEGHKTITGITNDEGEIVLILEADDSLEENTVLYSEKLHTPDLLGVLENLEQYAENF